MAKTIDLHLDDGEGWPELDVEQEGEGITWLGENVAVHVQAGVDREGRRVVALWLEGTDGGKPGVLLCPRSLALAAQMYDPRRFP